MSAGEIDVGGPTLPRAAFSAGGVKPELRDIGSEDLPQGL
jgi:hypothetical protein